MVELVVESWIWYGVVMLVAVSRFISRYMTLRSFRRFQFDEWAMIVVLCFYTTLIPCINIVRNTSSNLLPPGFDLDSLTEEDVRQRQYGSKLILVVEQCQCVIIWGAKACLLTLYLRLTTARWEHIAIKVLAAYVAVTFVVMEILYLGVWCRPFSNYWAVPTPSSQCDAATNHLITNAVFNMSSDVIMIAVGLPMFLRLKLPLKKKIPVVGVFSLGVFVILAAILNKVYSFTDPYGSEWTFWYVREGSTALLVANLPFVWTIWRKVTGQRGSSNGPSARRSTDSPTITRHDTLGRNKHYSRGHQASSDDPEVGVGGDALNMSLADILGEDRVDRATNEKDISLYTHPQLYFANKKKQQAAPKEDVADGDLALRQESIAATGESDPSTATHLSPSVMGSQKSAGSFL